MGWNRMGGNGKGRKDEWIGRIDGRNRLPRFSLSTKSRECEFNTSVSGSADGCLIIHNWLSCTCRSSGKLPGTESTSIAPILQDCVRLRIGDSLGFRRYLLPHLPRNCCIGVTLNCNSTDRTTRLKSFGYPIQQWTCARCPLGGIRLKQLI